MKGGDNFPEPYLSKLLISNLNFGKDVAKLQFFANLFCRVVPFDDRMTQKILHELDHSWLPEIKKFVKFFLSQFS